MTDLTDTPTSPTSLPLSPTSQHDLTLAGQRRINLIWECTQATIAICVVLTTMISGMYMTWTGTDRPMPTIMSMAFGTVVGFYFSRTNHTAIGGVGPKPTTLYEGR